MWLEETANHCSLLKCSVGIASEPEGAKLACLVNGLTETSLY